MEMDTDSVASCKVKLAYFRIKELKEVLTELGFSKQGRKQDLVDRISCLLSDERVTNIIDVIYRKMQNLEGADLATKGQSGLDLGNVKLKTEVEDSLNSDRKISCPCGNLFPMESLIKCDDPGCLVQQHIHCVVIPEEPMGDVLPLPLVFICEMCRIKKADPFWVTVEHLVLPEKLAASNIPTDGTNPLQSVEKTFQLTKRDRDLLQNTEYDVQAWCILLNDKVSFRMQWPQYADLQVNGLQVRTVNRPPAQPLGANGRDDGALITLFIGEGVNKISLSGCDARIFCFGVRLVKRRTVEQVLSLIPKETDGELFEDALARVRRCISGGVATENEDSDSDLEVIADSITVNLRCPMSGSRMKVAGRFKPCVHMGCFDLETFVELNQRSRKWQCPICLKNYSLEDIIIDSYFNRITTLMRNCGEDITEIVVKHDGSWTAKTKGEVSNLAQWHLPDGSLHVAGNEIISNSETSRQTRKEDGSEHTTSTVGVKKNLRTVEVSKHQPIILSSRNQMADNFEIYGEKVVTMSSSATGSGRDDEDPSINQGCSSYIDISINDDNAINFVPHSFGPSVGIENQTSAPTSDTDVIVLSDSEEENVNLVSPEIVYETFPVIDNIRPGIADSYLQDHALVAGASSCLSLFNGNGDDVGVSNWPYTSGTPAGCGFQFFGTDSDVSGVFHNMDHSSVTCTTPMNGYTEASKETIISNGEVLDSSICHTNIDDNLIHNTVAFVSEDPSLQNLLPSQPAVVFSESALGHHQPHTSNGNNSDDWISLRLGSEGEHVRGDVGSQSQSLAINGLEMGNGCGSNGAAFLSGEHRSNRTNTRKMSAGPFSFPRQPRSKRVHRF